MTNPFNNVLFLAGGAVLIVGLIDKVLEEELNSSYVLLAGAGLMLLSFWVHVSPLKLGKAI